MDQNQQEKNKLEKQFLEMYKVQQQRIQIEDIRRIEQYKKKQIHIMDLNKFNDSIFNKETLIGKLELTKENLSNPMLLNNLFVGENYSCLDDFLCAAKK